MPALRAHFLFGCTGSAELNAQLGSTWMPMIDLYNYAKVDGEGNLAADPMAPSGMERGLDQVIGNGFPVPPVGQADSLSYAGFGWQGLWSGYVLHQPFEGGTSYNDPDVVEAAMQAAELGAQRARRFGCTIVTLGGMDEPGLCYGVVQQGEFAGEAMTLFPDQFQRAEYERATGVELPADPRTLGDEDWLNWFRWRNGIIRCFMAQAGEHFRRVPHGVPWGQDLYASHAINDGTHPFDQRVNDIPVTHTFMFRRGACEQNWSFLLERTGRRDSRFHFASNTSIFGFNQPEETALADMVTNYGVMDGVGMLWHLSYREAESFRPSFARLLRFGDFINATLAARPPVAVLYSPTEAGAPTPAAFRHGDGRERAATAGGDTTRGDNRAP